MKKHQLVDKPTTLHCRPRRTPLPTAQQAADVIRSLLDTGLTPYQVAQRLAIPLFAVTRAMRGADERERETNLNGALD
jgi:hypothetical protein